MLSVITGKQRAGKTFYAVQKVIIYYLLNSDRHIYTNLPIFPHEIAKYCSKSFLEIDSYMERIHLFIDFSRHYVRYFKERDYVFWSFSRNNKKGKHLINKNRARELWNVIQANSVVVLDECYEIFNNMDYQDSGKKDSRRQLLSFCRQHGHYKLDMFLISHQLSDLDRFIRNGTQYLYMIRNSKYSNMIDFFTDNEKSFAHKMFRGFKWPIQFFIVDGFEYGEVKPSDRWIVWPDKRIFEMYDSFSTSHELKMEKSQSHQVSTDSKIDHKRNFLNYFGQSVNVFICVIACCVGVWFGWQAIKKMLAMNNKTFKGSNVVKDSNVESAKVAEASYAHDSKDVKETGKEKEKEKEKPLSVVFRSSERIKWSDGVELKKGELFKGFVVKDLKKTFVVLEGEGKEYKVAIEGVRK